MGESKKKEETKKKEKEGGSVARDDGAGDDGDGDGDDGKEDKTAGGKVVDDHDEEEGDGDEDEEEGDGDEENEDEEDEDEKRAEEEWKVIAPYVYDPAFVVYGAMKRRIGKTQFERLSKGPAECPNPLCCKVFTIGDGIRTHLQDDICFVKDDAARAIVDARRAEYRRLGAKAIAKSHKRTVTAEILIRDQPIFPSYKWPQKTGDWWTPLVFVKALMGVRDDPALPILQSWGLREGTAIWETKFLLKYEVFDPFLVSLGKHLQLVKSDAVIAWFETSMPLALQRLLIARTAPFLGLGALQRQAMVETIRETALKVIGEASSFNAALHSDRQEVRKASYSSSLQLTMSKQGFQPVAKGYVQGHRPFSVIDRQTQAPNTEHLCTLDERYKPPAIGTSATLAVFKKKKFDLVAFQMAHLKRRAAAKYPPSVQPPVNVYARCSVCSAAQSRGSTLKNPLITCTMCNTIAHVECFQLPVGVVHALHAYKWQCSDCKVCEVCRTAEVNNAKSDILFCDECDRGYHLKCVNRSSLPKGRWICPACASCDACGFTPRNSSDYKWSFVYGRKGGAERPFLKTLCYGCHNDWAAGNFCTICLHLFGEKGHDGALNAKGRDGGSVRGDTREHDDDDEAVRKQKQQRKMYCQWCDRYSHYGCNSSGKTALEKDSGFEREGEVFTCDICKGLTPDLVNWE